MPISGSYEALQLSNVDNVKANALETGEEPIAGARRIARGHERLANKLRT